jgi:trk system potassium uptake protein TrkH
MSFSLAKALSPARLIVSSIVFTIGIGTLLLMLPQARLIPMSFMDLLFTATSATCVTGVFTVSLDQFTFLGQCIILALIQIGGLGLITMTLFFIYLFTNVGLATHAITSQILELNSWKHAKRILIFTLFFTIICEVIGASILVNCIDHSLLTTPPLFWAFFHAISSFCNAGITLPIELMQDQNTNSIFVLITTILMLFGGIGFITWYEIIRYFGTYFNKKRTKLSLYSKIIIFTTLTLLIGATLMFWILERTNLLADLSLWQSITTSLFYVTSFKSSGFVMHEMTQLSSATLFMLLINSFIGSAPGSTGSGIKLTTFLIFISTAKSVIKGKTTVEIYKRNIPIDQVFKAIAIVMLGLSWVLLSIFYLLVAEPNMSLFEIVIESFGTFASLGISIKTGITSVVSTNGKLFIILGMLIGRIGSLTLLLGLKMQKKRDRTEFSYPEERVMLG